MNDLLLKNLRAGIDLCRSDDPDDLDASEVAQLRAAAAYAEAAEAMLRRQVTIARSMGETWATIGAALGVSRQAAQQRFRAEPAEPTA